MIGVAIGFMGGTFATHSSVVKLEQKIELAKKFLPSISDMRALTGVIEEVKGNALVIQSVASINPFEDLPKTREVLVTGATKIVRVEQKDRGVFQKEMEVFQKEMAKARKEQKGQGSRVPAKITPPVPFIEKSISLNDLKIADRVFVEAGENIKEKTIFTATRIRLNVAPKVSAPSTSTPSGAPAP